MGSGGLCLRVVTDGPTRGGSSGDLLSLAAGKSWSPNEGISGSSVISGDGALDGRMPVDSLDPMGGMVLGTTGEIGIGIISSDVSESVSIGDGGSTDNSRTMSSNRNICGSATGGGTGGATRVTGGMIGGATSGAAGGMIGGMTCGAAGGTGGMTGVGGAEVVGGGNDGWG